MFFWEVSLFGYTIEYPLLSTSTGTTSFIVTKVVHWIEQDLETSLVVVTQFLNFLLVTIVVLLAIHVFQKHVLCNDVYNK